MMREILRDYKKKIHGNEYEFHSKRMTLDEHNAYMDKIEDQALSQIKSELLGKLPKEILCEGLRVYGEKHSILDCPWCVSNRTLEKVQQIIEVIK